MTYLTVPGTIGLRSDERSGSLNVVLNLEDLPEPVQLGTKALNEKHKSALAQLLLLGQIQTLGEYRKSSEGIAAIKAHHMHKINSHTIEFLGLIGQDSQRLSIDVATQTITAHHPITDQQWTAIYDRVPLLRQFSAIEPDDRGHWVSAEYICQGAVLSRAGSELLVESVAAEEISLQSGPRMGMGITFEDGTHTVLLANEPVQLLVAPALGIAQIMRRVDGQTLRMSNGVSLQLALDPVSTDDLLVLTATVTQHDTGTKTVYDLRYQVQPALLRVDERLDQALVNAIVKRFNFLQLVAIERMPAMVAAPKTQHLRKIPVQNLQAGDLLALWEPTRMFGGGNSYRYQVVTVTEVLAHNDVVVRHEPTSMFPKGERQIYGASTVSVLSPELATAVQGFTPLTEEALSMADRLISAR